GFVLGWGLMCGTGEPRIAAPATSATSHRETVTYCGKVMQQLARFCVIDGRADGGRKLDGHSVASGSIAAFSMTAAFRFVFGIKPEMQQGMVVGARHHDDIAAAPAIPTAGPSARDVFFTPEREAAVTAVPGLHGDNDFVDKHGN